MRAEGTSLSRKGARPDVTLPNSWTADQHIPSHALLAVDIRFHSDKYKDADTRLLPPDTLPVKHFDIIATRLSDLENAVIGQTQAEAPSQPEEQPADDYYEWLAEFNTKLFPQAQTQTGDIRSLLTDLAALEDSYLRKFQTLLLLDYQAYKPLSQEKDLLDHFWDVIRQRRDTTLDPTITKTALAALRDAREEIRVKKAAIAPLKRQLIDEGLKIMKQLLEKADVAGIRFRERHPEIKQTISFLKDKCDLLRLELYDAAKIYEGDGFSKLMSELGFGPGTEQELRELLRAKGALARAGGFERRMALLAASPTGLQPDSENEMKAKRAKAEALDALDTLLKVNPGNKEAGFMRQAIELSFVEAIAAKLDHEKQASLLAYQKFFEDRGFSTEDPGGWWSGFFEGVYAWTGMGPVSSILGWAKAIETADATDIQQTAIAKHHVALLAIRKLLRNGMPLQKIRTITPAEMERGMSVATANKSSLPEGKIRQLCKDIHETFAELGDLRALAEGRRDEFIELHPKAYYDLIQPEKSRGEFWTDFFFSPLSLVGWCGPGAITKVEGTWQWFKLSTTAGHIALLEDI
jgi:hypothetical protein